MTVSIIIPTYNSVETIVETLKSVKNQKHKDIEIIIVDDGSSDNTLQVINDNFKDIQILKQQNAGPSAARNLGAKNASGNYLCFVDSDDVIYPDFISECLKEHLSCDKLEIVYPKVEYIGAKLGEWELPEYSLNSFLSENCIPIYAMIKKDTFLKSGMFDSHLKFNEDWELWIKIIKNGGEVKRIPKILYQYRKHKEKKSLTDLSTIKDNSDKAKLYIYNKHYDFYKKKSLGIGTLLGSFDENLKYKRKYYNTWYRKFIYKFFKPNKYKSIYGNLN